MKGEEFFDFKMEDEGIEELFATIELLPRNLELKVLTNAAAAAARQITKKWQFLAPSNRLASNTSVVRGRRAARALRTTKQNVNGLAVAGFNTPDSRLAHLIEFGTAERFHRDGHPTGHMTAQPFIRPGLDQAKAPAAKAMQRLLISGLKRQAKLARDRGL